MASASELRQRVIERAQKDSDFRKMLVSNPREAIRSEIGVELPSKLQVQVLQESDQQIYLVLPRENGELSDDQLDSVSGGLTPAPMFV